MTWVDAAIIGVLAVSAMLAFLRGFVREVLGVGAWIGAAVLAVWTTPYIRPHFEIWLSGRPGLAEPVAYAVVFLISLVILLLLCHWIGALVRASVLGGLDRTLGLVFGLARGAALVVLAYILAGFVIPVERWPTPVLEARTLPFAYAGASWIAGRLPADYRPRIYPPPQGRQATANALLRASPHGRALGPAFTRD
jgi:membrane protein required for colicin V production